MVTAFWGDEPEFSARPEWLWLLGAADASGLAAWNRKRRMVGLLEGLDKTHEGEAPLWLRWSHPSENVDDLLRTWHRYSVWNRQHRTGLDLVGVVDRGTTGEMVWHIHGYGFGPDLDLEDHASVWGRCGGYPFVRARRLRVGGGDKQRGYVLRKVRGYVSGKQGARRLRLRS